MHMQIDCHCHSYELCMVKANENQYISMKAAKVQRFDNLLLMKLDFSNGTRASGER